MQTWAREIQNYRPRCLLGNTYQRGPHGQHNQDSKDNKSKKDVVPQGVCRLVICYRKELKVTDVWITVSTGLIVSMEHIFQLQIYQRPPWSLWVHKKKWKKWLTLSSHSYSWRHGKLTRLGHMTRSLRVGFTLHHFRQLLHRHLFGLFS